MRTILMDDEEELSQITTSRILTLLGQKSKYRGVKKALINYFNKTDFLDLWYDEAEYHFTPPGFPGRFDTQSLTCK